MRGRYAWAWNFGPVIFDHGVLTLCSSGGDGSTHHGAFADFVSFLVSSRFVLTFSAQWLDCSWFSVRLLFWSHFHS